MLEVLKGANLYLHAAKCNVACHSVTLLGRTVDRYGLSTTAERVAAIQSLAFPKNLQQLENFLEMINYHQTHSPYYARIAQPLEQLKTELLRQGPKGGRKRKGFAPYRTAAEHHCGAYGQLRRSEG